MPHAGEMDGMYYALGYAGHGVAMATYQGQLMAEQIAGEKPDKAWVDELIEKIGLTDRRKPSENQVHPLGKVISLWPR